MNIQQFQYILAVAENRHFEQAAEHCNISQSTLSTMISKFEDEIGIQIFDRKRKPVEITSEGSKILEQLKTITREIEQLKELTQEIKGEIKGKLSISVIPTIAPFLLPLFLQKFASRFPNLEIQVKEQTTSEILRQLKLRELDIGIISIPALDKDIVETKLYDEPFVFFDSGRELNQKVESKNLDISKLCLLEEGHCMRTQVVNLCDSHKLNFNSTLNFDYKAGSIDSLLRFVKANQASTLLPYLATLDMSEDEQRQMIRFVDPVPFRTIGLVVHTHFVKKKVLEALQNSIMEEVLKVIPEPNMKGNELLPL